MITSAHINGWKDLVFQTKTHISQGWTGAMTKQRQMLSSVCVCVCVCVCVDVEPDTHTDNQGVINTRGPPHRVKHRETD